MGEHFPGFLGSKQLLRSDSRSSMVGHLVVFLPNSYGFLKTSNQKSKVFPIDSRVFSSRYRLDLEGHMRDISFESTSLG